MYRRDTKPTIMLQKTTVDENLDHFFNNQKCTAKLNLAFDFILRKAEDGGFTLFYANERFRFFCAQENNTLLDRSKIVSTKDDLAKPKDTLNKAVVIKLCSEKK